MKTRELKIEFTGEEATEITSATSERVAAYTLQSSRSRIHSTTAAEGTQGNFVNWTGGGEVQPLPPSIYPSVQFFLTVNRGSEAAQRYRRRRALPRTAAGLFKNTHEVA